MNLYTRNGTIYVDINTKDGRYRASTKLIATRENQRLIDNLFRDFNNKISKKVVKNTLDTLRKNKTTSQNITLEDYANRYVNNKKLLLKTSCVIESQIKLILNFFGSSMDLRYLKYQDIEDFIHFLGNQRTKIYNKTTLGHLKNICELAVIDERIDKNPVRDNLKVSGLNIKEKEPYNLEEIIQIIKSFKDQETKTYFTLGFFSGMRCGEMFVLEWEDLDFEGQIINITKTLTMQNKIQSPKTEKSKRQIDMLDIVKQEFLAFKSKNSEGRIFKGSYGQLQRKFQGKLQEITQTLGLKKNSLYITRHSFASVMLSKGEEAMWVGMHMLGHSNLNMTYKTYAKYIKQPQRERAGFLNRVEL